MEKCPKCKAEMEKVIFDVGYGVEVNSMHCDKCGFNITESQELNKGLKMLKDQMAKEAKIVRIGNGLGIRFPNEIVKALKLHKGENIVIKPELDGIKIMQKC